MAGTSWPSLIAGNKAKASEVEDKFDWIEGSIVPMNAGNKTNAVYDLGESSYRWKTIYGVDLNLSGNITCLTLTTDEIVLTTTTRYYSIPPILTPRVISSLSSWYNDGYQFLGYDINPASAVCPIHLPHNAIITGAKAKMWRITSGSSIIASIERINLTSGTHGLFFVGTATATEINTKTTVLFQDLTGTTIDNEKYAYYFKINFDIEGSIPGGAIKFYGSRITYTITTPLP